MRRGHKVIIWIVVAAFVLGGGGAYIFSLLSPPAAGSPEETVLVVEGQKITRSSLGQAYDNLIQYYTQLYQYFGMNFEEQLRGTEGAFRSGLYLAQAAEELIRQTLIDQEVRRLRIKVSQAEVDQAEEQLYQDVLDQFQGDEASLEYALSLQGLTLTEYRNSLRREAEGRLREEKLRRVVVGAIEPTGAELLAYYEEHQDAYQTEPEQIRIAHILVSQKELAEEILAGAKAGADFGALAREHSEDEATREQGGEMDWFARGGSGLSSQVEEAAFALEVGQVALVEDAEGHHVVKLLDRRPPVVPPMEEIRDQVEEDYVKEEEARRFDEWYESLRQDAVVEIRDPLLSAFMAHSKGDVEAALAILLSAGQAGTITDPRLPYYIGRLYEDLYMQVGQTRASLEQKERTPEEEAELERLRGQEQDYKEKAIEYYLAFAQTGEGDEDFLNRFCALDPQNPQAHYRLAELYRERGQYVQADREYQLALEAEGDFTAALIGQGDTAMAMGLYGRAVERYQEALKLQTGSQTIELKLAEAHVRDGRYEEARPLLEGILAEQPDLSTALLLLGDLLLGEGDAAGAIAHYEEAFRQNPTTEAKLKLAQAYLEASRLEEARRHYQDVTRQFPYRAEGYLGLGDVLREQGEPERALEQYRQALSRASDPALREEIAKRIMALAPEDTSVRFQLANYYREGYKYDAAIGQYEAILSLVPPDSEDAYFALVGLGDCYVPKIQYDMALEHYRRALEVARTPAQRLSVYDKIVASEEARAGPDGTLSAEGLQALWERALLYHEQGRDEEAKADLERIYELDPTFRALELVPLLSELGVEVQTPSQTIEPQSG